MKPILVSCPRFWAIVKGYELHERLITYMSLNQDSRCDAKCQGCFRYPDRKSGPRNLLGMSDYASLLKEFHRLGGLALEISGEGEPLLSPFTLPIIRLASDMNIWTTLITNGHLLDARTIEELKGLKVALVLSLHSLKREIYEEDSGIPGSFEIKKQIIDLVSRFFKGTEWRECGRLVRRAAIHWTLQANNLEEVDQAREFCDQKGLLFSIAPLARTGHASERPDLWVSRERRLEEVNALGDESIIFYDEPSGRLVCGTCRHGLNVGADGNLLLDAHGGYEVEIANIRDTGLEKAVNLQRGFAHKMFGELDGFCPVRDPDWENFLARKGYS